MLSIIEHECFANKSSVSVNYLTAFSLIKCTKLSYKIWVINYNPITIISIST